MKRMVNTTGNRGPQKRRKSVAQILRASYERFVEDEESLKIATMVLGRRSKANTSTDTDLLH